jgi:hypothetical protein
MSIESNQPWAKMFDYSAMNCAHIEFGENAQVIEESSMSIVTRTAAIGLVAFLSISASSAMAQYVPRTYQKGPVTLVTQYQIAPGKLNTFMQDYTTNQRAGLEIGKKTGGILSYGVATPITRRAGEPNLSTIITFKDLASYDRSYEAADKASIAVYGSLDKAAQAAAKRSEYATVVSSFLLQNLTLPN